MTIQVAKSLDGSGWYWTIKAKNGKTIAVSVSTSMRWDHCLETVNSLAIETGLKLTFHKSCKEKI